MVGASVVRRCRSRSLMVCVYVWMMCRPRSRRIGLGRRKLCQMVLGKEVFVFWFQGRCDVLGQVP